MDNSSSSILYNPDSILFKMILFIALDDDVSETINKPCPEYSEGLKDSLSFK